MDTQKLKARRAERRAFRVRNNMLGTPEKPRLSVHRTNLHIYAQLIDDVNGVTVAAAASNAKDAGLEYGGNIKAAQEVGRKLAEKAVAKGITAAAFDRGHYRFHGRVAALARAALAGGLVCTSPEKPKAEKPAAEAKPAAKEKGEKGAKKDGGPKKEKPAK